MRTMNLLLILSTALSATLVAMPAHAQPGTCVYSTSYCVCVLSNCTDASTGHSCLASVGWTNNTQSGFACNADGIYQGSVDGVDDGVLCQSTATIRLSTLNGAVKYDQLFTSALDSPSGGCNDEAVRSRSYTDADADFAWSGDTLTITRFSPAGLERTALTFVSGGAYFSQSFQASPAEGPYWNAAGFLGGVAVVDGA